MKILVIIAGYPDLQGGKASSFVHTRNLYYAQHGITPVVLNFRATEDYVIDGIQVIRLSTYTKQYQAEQFDILASHASNLREHYRFLKKYKKNFPHIVFFFHGHEVLRINECYPKPFSYMKQKNIQRLLMQDLYDNLKFAVLRKAYKRLANKSAFVFVSEWMRERFFHYLKLRPQDIYNHDYVIYNCIGEVFEKESYELKENLFDFITVRNNLDGSKYCIDIVNHLATKNPDLRFLVIGKGKFFQHIQQADNLVWKDATMNHQGIVEELQSSRCALMPTRLDAQGLMTCEMATYGIPVITSDIPVCHEIVSSFENVRLIDNEDMAVDLASIMEELCRGVPYPKNTKYFAENTLQKEIELFWSILKEESK